jgi:hypothetical protein
VTLCPQCQKPIGITTTECPHCGYDWPESDLPRPMTGWEDSPLADAALMIAAVLSGLLSLFCFLGIFVEALLQQWVNAFIWFPLMGFYQLALLIVFIRLSRPR